MGRIVGFNQHKQTYVFANGILKYEIKKIPYILWNELLNFSSFDKWYKAFEKDH